MEYCPKPCFASRSALLAASDTDFTELVVLIRRHIRPPSPRPFIEYWQGNKQGNLLLGVLFVTV